jgi:hypothetical protein
VICRFCGSEVKSSANRSTRHARGDGNLGRGGLELRADVADEVFGTALNMH